MTNPVDPDEFLAIVGWETLYGTVTGPDGVTRDISFAVPLRRIGFLALLESLNISFETEKAPRPPLEDSGGRGIAGRTAAADMQMGREVG